MSRVCQYPQRHSPKSSPHIDWDMWKTPARQLLQSWLSRARQRLRAVIRGLQVSRVLHLVDSDYFTKCGVGGSCMAWTPAISMQRSIWFSTEWADANHLLSSLVIWACRLPSSRWRLRSESWGRGGLCCAPKENEQPNWHCLRKTEKDKTCSATG